MNFFPTIDFETDGIVGNPLVNPPKPCGVSIKWPGHASTYFAFGHPTNNNCSRANAIQALEQVIDSGAPIVFHNSGFDLSVMGSMPELTKKVRFLERQWKRVHDTLYLIFFADPYASTLSLKPSSERWLGIPPTEQTELKNWILTHVPEATKDNWAAYISRTPGDLCAKYATGDTDRTDGLFALLYPRIVEQGMLDAYERERRLFPVLLEATRRGVRVDREKLEKDTTAYTAALDECEIRLCANLGITRETLEDNEEAFKDGLERCGAVKEWVLTPKSQKRSMAEGNLKIVIPQIKDLIDYRGALKTSLQTFMRPWLEHSSRDGRVHPNWNQVRQAKGAFGTKGARTGRLSCDDPNLMNLPTTWEYKDKTPMVVPAGLLPYPILRQYMLAELGHVWLKRDFSSQEIRIAAHFEDGQLKEAYIRDPDLDPHEMAKQIILAMTQLELSRIWAKIIGFQIIYGGGGPAIASNLNISIEQARALRYTYLNAMPGIDALMKDVQLRGKVGTGIRTWGGRIYQSEKSKDGREFHYKLLNYLIQGSAADQTKDCINVWDETKLDGSIFLATVHDEINISAPTCDWIRHMEHLKGVMERNLFDVPFRSEGFYGVNWADLKEAA